MTQRVFPAVLAVAVVFSGCAGRHRLVLGASQPLPPPSMANIQRGLPQPAPGPADTAAPVTVTGPAAVATNFTLAYFSARPGDGPSQRRQRCRPFDTAALDQLLGVPSWSGAGNDTVAGEATRASIDAVNLVDQAASPAAGLGYELTVTITVTGPGGGQVSRDYRGVQLRLTSDPGDTWLVDQLSVT
jgi:hypothetical protein